MPLTLAAGAEDYLASLALTSLRSQLRKLHSNLEYHQLDSEYAAGQLLNLASPSLFSEPRFISIQTVTAELIADLKTLASSAMDDQTYVFIRVSGNSAAAKSIRKDFPSAQVVACEELKRDSDKQAFVISELKLASKQIEPRAARQLVSSFNSDLAELGAACSQLSSLDTEKISFELVDDLFGGREETNSFKVADAAISGNTAEALRLLRHSLNTGTDPVPMVAALAMRIRQMAKLISNQNVSAAAVGMQSWQLDRVRRDLSGWSETSLANVVRLLAETDQKIKGGSRHPLFELEKLVVAIATRN
jgi:DNA polymerase-3 subunit delta